MSMGCFRIYVGNRSADVHRVACGVQTEDRSVILEPELAPGAKKELNAPANPEDFLCYISEVRSVARLAAHPPCERNNFTEVVSQLYEIKRPEEDK